MVVGGIGTILTAGYFLWMLQRVNQGVEPEKWMGTSFRDILSVEWVSWTPLLVADPGPRAGAEHHLQRHARPA